MLHHHWQGIAFTKKELLTFEQKLKALRNFGQRNPRLLVLPYYELASTRPSPCLILELTSYKLFAEGHMASRTTNHGENVFSRLCQCQEIRKNGFAFFGMIATGIRDNLTKSSFLLNY